jgi:hypothetical protein
MPIDWRDHQRLEQFCKTVCTGKIGWNRARRKDCRERTMCEDVQRLHRNEHLCPKCGYDLTANDGLEARRKQA